MSELNESIKQVIEGEDVALFMKGTPQMIMCGNSLRALEALRRAGAPVTTVDILPDPAIRQELSAVSGWPTIPQVFVQRRADRRRRHRRGARAIGRARAHAGGEARARLPRVAGREDHQRHTLLSSRTSRTRAELALGERP